jgi:hypothetical protein
MKYHVLLTMICGACLTGSVLAQELMVFPNEGQSAEQQQQDEFECYNWAKGQSGFDPMAPPTATTAPPAQEAPKGGAGRGMLRGAAIGGIVDGSDGAKTGAAVGLVGGSMRRQDQKRKEEASRQQWEQEQQQIYAENRNRYNRGYSACLEGKSYTVR